MIVQEGPIVRGCYCVQCSRRFKGGLAMEAVDEVVPGCSLAGPNGHIISYEAVVGLIEAMGGIVADALRQEKSARDAMGW